MSTTTTNLNPLSPTSSGQTCPQCGHNISHIVQGSQRRISELETQVRILTDKATAAVDKLADYEDQIHQLRLRASQPSPPFQFQQSPPPHLVNHNIHIEPPSRPSSATSTLHTRLTSLLPSSKRAASQPPSSAPPTQLTHPQSSPQTAQRSASATTAGHQHTSSNPLPAQQQYDGYIVNGASGLADGGAETLQHERSLRMEAERKLQASSAELEELSAQLFAEANEMVGQERRARAQVEARATKLTKKVEELEAQAQAEEHSARGKDDDEKERKVRWLEERVRVLEGREGEKRVRWEELEKRVGRVERVRELLAGGAGGGGSMGKRSVSASVVEPGGGAGGNVDGEVRAD
ncbi:MAG: hypothetical protein LQ351_006500 [Letrouitia transgressa]|nr:MAG: hypothetical protein LQ351_006500 [Letrouitia transgressa]